MSRYLCLIATTGKGSEAKEEFFYCKYHVNENNVKQWDRRILKLGKLLDEDPIWDVYSWGYQNTNMKPLLSRKNNYKLPTLRSKRVDAFLTCKPCQNKKQWYFLNYKCASNSKSSSKSGSSSEDGLC